MKKQHGVVMLPNTNDRSQPGQYPCIAKKLSIDEGEIVYPKDTKLLWLCERTMELMPYKAQYLHFTSDEEPKIDEPVVRRWYPLQNSLTDAVVKHTQGLQSNSVSVKKIVASTDPSLGLPSIQQSFIQKYVESNGKIDKVQLEMIENWAQRHSIGKWDDCELTIKLTENNEVIVVDEPHTSKEYPVLTQRMNKDQSLEDAAENRYKTVPEKTKWICKDSFKEGADWREKQSTNEAIELIYNLFAQPALFNGYLKETSKRDPREVAKDLYNRIKGQKL